MEYPIRKPRRAACALLVVMVAAGGCGIPDADNLDALTKQMTKPGLGGLDTKTPTSCDFDYDTVFHYPQLQPVQRPSRLRMAPRHDEGLLGIIAHAEPEPPGHHWLAWQPEGGALSMASDSIVMPSYTDSMPLFPRSAAWSDQRRCYEIPAKTRMLTEDQAYDLYRSIAELTTGITLDVTPQRRSVVGLRGSYPGRFAWHNNLPDRFNDTLVLLWIDREGAKRVREFPANTDTGMHDFGENSSSSLRPNRRYRYINGWHKTYNALKIAESEYAVRDDANHNGHWDSDRNGWLAPSSALDHDRTGSAHNIHMASVEPPLGDAAVGVWSAGCQVIPGMANWTEFISSAWTKLDDPVDYFLVDVRDVDHRVWASCTENGSHQCPYRIATFPFAASGNTDDPAQRVFNRYNCSDDDESGPEVVYEFTVDKSGTLTATLDTTAFQGAANLELHLLDGDDANACLEHDHQSVSRAITPGRYFIIVDTRLVDGVEKSGPYQLSVKFE